MTGLELLADEVEGGLTAAVVRKGVLDDLYIDAAHTPDASHPKLISGASAPARWGSFYLGKVIKIDTKLDAAFVDLGSGLSGFLPAKHVRHPGADESESRSGISSLLTGGQMIIVQVKSEGKSFTENENQKLPRLTMKLYVPGLFLTYSPSSNQVTISRKIENEELLALTAKLKGKGGWIVRHHIEKASGKDIEFEARHLQEIWQHILAARNALGDKPGLLQAGPDAVTRALTDYGAVNFEHIYAGNKQILARITDWCAEHYPALASSKRLRLFKPEKTSQKLFDIHDIYGVIETLKESRVHLDSGATLVIEPTSALTFIDVNQGSAESIAAANQSAAQEVARQCRLRSLSGAILIDFINMEQKEERARLLAALTALFTPDLASAQVHGFTRLGIAELTRKRRTATLSEKLKK
jgi:Rne/Rng family ribonuclease